MTQHSQHVRSSSAMWVLLTEQLSSHDTHRSGGCRFRGFGPGFCSTVSRQRQSHRQEFTVAHVLALEWRSYLEQFTTSNSQRPTPRPETAWAPGGRGKKPYRRETMWALLFFSVWRRWWHELNCYRRFKCSRGGGGGGEKAFNSHCRALWGGTNLFVIPFNLCDLYEAVNPRMMNQADEQRETQHTFMKETEGVTWRPRRHGTTLQTPNPVWSPPLRGSRLLYTHTHTRHRCPDRELSWLLVKNAENDTRNELVLENRKHGAQIFRSTPSTEGKASYHIVK